MHAVKLKMAFVAAAVGFASGAQANFSSTNSAAGGDLLFAFLTDSSSYVKDLGISYDAFNPNLAQSFALDAFAFTPSQVTAGAFQVINGKFDSGTVFDLVTTVTGNPAPASLGITSYLQTLDAQAGYENAIPGFAGPEGVPVQSTNPAESQHVSRILGFRWGNNTTFGTGVAGTNVANFYKIDSDPNTGDTTTSLLGSFRIQAPGPGAAGYSLQYAPVPEPGTYAMFAAGLLVLGAVARRKVQR